MLYQQVIEYNLITTIKLISIMKKLLIILLSIVIITDIVAQNTLDNIGLTSSAPAALAYSFRKLSSTYSGSAIQVRRSSDNTTQDIGFSGGELDTASLKTFVGSNSGYISIWYDQSGNGTNLSQGTQSNQPRIVNAGVIDRENGKPFVRFYTTSGYNSLNLSSDKTTTAQIIVVNKFGKAAGDDGFILGHTSSYYWHSDNTGGRLISSANADASIKNSTVFQNSRSIAPLSAIWNTALMINSITPSTPASGTTWNNIGSDRNIYHRTSGGGGYTELIVFNSAILASERLTVEINEETYYSISRAGNLNENGKISTVPSEYVSRNGAIGGAAIFTSGESVASQLPVLSSTTAADGITSVSAVSGGNLTSDGGGAPLTVGICWNTSTNPTTANSITAATGTTGSFVGNLTGLTGGTVYYVRAYGTNSIGTAYGNEINFTTLAPVVPTLTATTAATSVFSTSAISGGSVTSDGGAAITDRGVCWSTSVNPTITDATLSSAGTLGGFTSNITGLTVGLTYHVRAYATNSVGTAYGNDISFTTALAIGESYQGGKIAYFFVNGDSGYVAGEIHGLIATTSNLTNSSWGCSGTSISGADGTAIGTGKQNTIDILAGCATAGIAARRCMGVTINGYNDWYLPSKDELGKLYINKTAIGSFVSTGYLSSSEIDSGNVWSVNFSNGTPSSFSKSTSSRVRAVRSF